MNAESLKSAFQRTETIGVQNWGQKIIFIKHKKFHDENDNRDNASILKYVFFLTCLMTRKT